MMKRFGAGILLCAAVVMVLSVVAYAERPGGREWRPKGNNPMVDASLPLIFRSAGDTTWVRVYNPGTSACDPADTVGSPTGQTIEHVWCFEGAGGDSTWPAAAPNPPSETWRHWSKFNPPLPQGSKWHISTRHPGTATGTYTAWAGCDSLGTNPACTDVSFWIFQEGYGDDWNYSLVLDCSGIDATSGGTLTFDVRYDCECNYDYLYLEYYDGSEWDFVEDSGGTPAVFNAVSGNFTSNPNTGRDCGDDYFGTSDQRDLGAGTEAYYGNSIWLTGVSFPIPAQSGGIQLRWRAFSDGAWSDADGRGDTDGIGAIDNVTAVFAVGPTTVTDDFESGDFNGITTTGPGTAASWNPGGLEGNTYDGWHLQFDPKYKNKGNTCTFSDDWMWAAKPASSAIPESGFSFYLASPVIPCNGWTGGIVEYSGYMCFLDVIDDYSNQECRYYDSGTGGWSLWNDFDGFITFAGCEFWNFNDNDDLTPYLGPTVDSIQVAWSVLDVDKPGDFAWGMHGSAQYLIDNVSFGEFDGEATVFTARVIDIYADTFSKSDPAHTPFLQNAEQGDWIGSGGGRRFANSDSLTVEIADYNGFVESNVDLWWRHDDGGTGTFGSWWSVQMDRSIPDPLSPSDEGTYRAIIGKDDGGVEDAEGTAGNGLIWKAGTTVEYYVKVIDNQMNEATWPVDAADPQDAAYFEFSVLPFGKTTDAGDKILLVDDYTRNALDFENSTGFNPVGGAGYGSFDDPAYEQPEDLVEWALAVIYGGDEDNPKWDKYDVQGGGSSVQCEPNGDPSQSDVGAYMNPDNTPYYDAMIWLQGTFADYSFADTTRIQLKTYLDEGGHLLAFGDDIAFHLGSGGNNADSTIGFLTDYFGTSFPNSADDATDNRVLNATGQAGTSMDGITLGLYGECPLRRAFDRLTLAATTPYNTNSVLMTYTASTANDNGRPCMIKNVRTVNGGTAVLAAWGVSALISNESRVCVLYQILNDEFGISAPAPAGLVCKNGVDAPVIANTGFGFSLADAAPNPFRSSTSIEFSVANRTRVSIEVYNILGQKVRTVADEVFEAGSYNRMWDGRSDAGTQVSSGIYFYKMVAGDFSATKKTVLLK
jgi:hypothetical protein